ncbi:hypothetical protein FA15DRAFT_673590 [Coprinopsis marcescibilis]|uniref:Uncharacterized protein n=1 Tax=Coprinopsis marcescibilis TaxID=230819 RepID=A0A5C3KJQ3_COPMA|nr:hypothetical protein FA15DRAFT_673590 [Coprinopsis marcescibilis]
MEVPSTKKILDSIPFEIVGKIFLEALPQNPRPDPTQPPLLLTQICRQWRSIADTSPELWSQIEIKVTFQGHMLTTPSSFAKYKSQIKNRQALIARWLTKASSARVSLSLYILDHSLRGVFPSVRLRVNREVINPFLNHIFAEQFTRNWYDVNIVSVEEPYQSRLFMIPSNHLPSLKRLSFNGHCARSSMRSESDKQPLSSLFESGMIQAPVLEALSISGIETQIQLSTLPLANWSGLTELRVDRRLTRATNYIPNEDYHAAFIRCADTLCMLAFSGGDSPGPYDAPTPTSTDPTANTTKPYPPLTFPHLPTLTVTECISYARETSELHPLVSSLLTPALQSLHWHTRDQPTQTSSSALLSFARTNTSPSQPTLLKLTTLSLCYSHLTHPELLELLEMLSAPAPSALKTLKLHSSDRITFNWRSGIYATRCALLLSSFLDRLTPKTDPPVHEPSESSGHTSPSPSTALASHLILLPSLEEFSCELGHEEEFTDLDLLYFIQSRRPTAQTHTTSSSAPSHLVQPTKPYLKKVSVKFVSKQTIDIAAALAEPDHTQISTSDLTLEVSYGNKCRWEPDYP